jgi:hypothetical protein
MPRMSDEFALTPFTAAAYFIPAVTVLMLGLDWTVFVICIAFEVILFLWSRVVQMWIMPGSGWAASRKKGSYFSALYRRLAARRGKKRAIVAIAHALLTVVYHMLKTHSHYYELGSNYFDQLHPEATVRYHTGRLQQMGYEVILQPKAAA